MWCIYRCIWITGGRWPLSKCSGCQNKTTDGIKCGLLKSIGVLYSLYLFLKCCKKTKTKVYNCCLLVHLSTFWKEEIKGWNTEKVHVQSVTASANVRGCVWKHKQSLITDHSVAFQRKVTLSVCEDWGSSLVLRSQERCTLVVPVARQSSKQFPRDASQLNQ